MNVSKNINIRIATCLFALGMLAMAGCSPEEIRTSGGIIKNIGFAMFFAGVIGMLIKLATKKQIEKSKSITTSSFTEKNNQGTRCDSVDFANSYWMGRMMGKNAEPYVLYSFDNAADARKALLELPCVHEAVGTGKLVCTEMLMFGFYETEQKNFEAVIAGWDLSHELWQAAKAGFERHGGKRKNDQEPEKRAAPQVKPVEKKPGEVVFVREDRRPGMMGGEMIYRIHKAPDAGTAKAFLDRNPVTQPLYYLIVETPEGNYCRDIKGFYKE